jgi:hypothetical protein
MLKNGEPRVFRPLSSLRYAGGQWTGGALLSTRALLCCVCRRESLRRFRPPSHLNSIRALGQLPCGGCSGARLMWCSTTTPPPTSRSSNPWEVLPSSASPFRPLSLIFASTPFSFLSSPGTNTPSLIPPRNNSLPAWKGGGGGVGRAFKYRLSGHMAHGSELGMV